MLKTSSLASAADFDLYDDLGVSWTPKSVEKESSCIKQELAKGFDFNTELGDTKFQPDFDNSRIHLRIKPIYNPAADQITGF